MTKQMRACLLGLVAALLAVSGCGKSQTQGGGTVALKPKQIHTFVLKASPANAKIEIAVRSTKCPITYYLCLKRVEGEAREYLESGRPHANAVSWYNPKVKDERKVHQMITDADWVLLVGEATEPTEVTVEFNPK